MASKKKVSTPRRKSEQPATTTAPSLTEWQALYRAADQIAELAPWTWMEETDVFAVENPETGEMGFVSATGTAGDHPSVTVYCGAAALYQFLEILAHDEPEFRGASEAILEIPQLQASFEARTYLQPEDVAVIVSLGLHYRGANGWPMFRSFTPGYIPWFVDAAEARFLTHVLEQMDDVAPRFREDPALLRKEGNESFLSRIAARKGSSLTWEDQIIRVAEPPRAAIPMVVPEEMLTSLSKLPRGGEPLDVDLFLVPALVGEEGGRAPYMHMLLMVGARTGMVLGHEILTAVPTLDKMLGAVAGHVATAIVEVGTLPIEVRVRSWRMLRLLQPLTMKLGIALELLDELVALDKARTKLERMFTRGR